MADTKLLQVVILQHVEVLARHICASMQLAITNTAVKHPFSCLRRVPMDVHTSCGLRLLLPLPLLVSMLECCFLLFATLYHLQQAMFS